MLGSSKPALLKREDKIIKAQQLRFQAVEKLIQMTVTGQARALIVGGAAGIGKTYIVTQAAKKYARHRKFTMFKGHASPTGLYSLLYENRGEDCVVVLDDSDTSIASIEALNILKAALDTSETRIISWRSKAKITIDVNGEEEVVPTSFEFKGSVIFLTNMNFAEEASSKSKNAPHFEALLSRSHYVDMGINTNHEKLLRLLDVTWRAGLLKKHDRRTQEAIYQYMEDNVDNLREISMRTVIKISALAESSRQWKSLAGISVLKTG